MVFHSVTDSPNSSPKDFKFNVIPSPRLVTLPSLYNLVCPTILPTAEQRDKGITFLRTFQEVKCTASSRI